MDRKSQDSTLVLVSGLKGQENVYLWDNNEIDVKSISGFTLGTVTTVYQNKALEETADTVLSKYD